MSTLPSAHCLELFRQIRNFLDMDFSYELQSRCNNGLLLRRNWVPRRLRLRSSVGYRICPQIELSLKEGELRPLSTSNNDAWGHRLSGQKQRVGRYRIRRLLRESWRSWLPREPLGTGMDFGHFLEIDSLGSAVTRSEIFTDCWKEVSEQMRKLYATRDLERLFSVNGYFTSCSPTWLRIEKAGASGSAYVIGIRGRRALPNMESMAYHVSKPSIPGTSSPSAASGRIEVQAEGEGKVE